MLNSSVILLLTQFATYRCGQIDLVKVIHNYISNLFALHSFFNTEENKMDVR